MTARRLCRAAAALLVVTAALFVAGVAVERSDSASETGSTTHTESADEAHHDEAAEHTEPGGAAAESTHHDDERVLGLDLEAGPLVLLAALASLALAAGLWLWGSRAIAGAAAVFASLFTVLDVAELAHHIDESRTGLAVLAGLIAVGHLLAAAASARAAIRPNLKEAAT